MLDPGGCSDRPAHAAYLAPKLQRANILDHSIVFISIGGLGIGGWLVWNLAIPEDPLYFQAGQFGKPWLWISRANPVVGNLCINFKTYWYAMSDTKHCRC